MTTYEYEPLPPLERPRNRGDHYSSGQLSTRLLTIHGGQYDDDIEVDLEVVDLNDQLPDLPAYDAMSYVWGSPEMVGTVYVGKEKKTVGITASLDDAIRHMRYPDRPRTMWIDGLCIDQKSIEERGRQVAYMCYIFWGATRVVAWLGRAADDSDRAMDTIQHIASRVKAVESFDVIKGITDLDEEQWGERATAVPLEDAEHLSILALLARPWFERIWIRQEIEEAGEESLVACGTKTLPWTAVRRALACFLGIHTASVDLGTSRGSRRRFTAAHHLLACQAFIIQGLIVCLRGTKCTDPRDRVYGLLGILDDGHYLDVIRPDYSKSVSEVYCSVILEHITRHGSMEFLLSCHKDSRENHSIAAADAIPTWVPDWDHPDSDPDHVYFCMRTERRLCPFRHSAEYLGRGVLRVAGVSYGRVIEVFSLDDSTLEALATSIHARIPPNAADTPYPGGGDLLDAFRMVLCADAFVDNQYPPNWPRQGSPAAGSLLRYEESQKAITRLMNQEEISGEYHRFLKLVESNNRIGRFFITSSGYLGWSPTRIMEGDEVTSILGCQAPMILRRSPIDETHFEVVGPSYTHGSTYGSAFLGPLPPTLRPIWHDTDTIRRGMNFHDLETGAIYSEDPRFEKLPADPLTEYRKKRERGRHLCLLSISPETWRSHGVDVVTFDLI